MSQVVLQVRNLSKRYRLGATVSAQQTLRELVYQTAGRLMPRRRIKQDRQAFWALKDIDFSVSQGESVGIIGQNGAGKSTLLKVLSSITDPTTGFALIRGQVSSLLEVGTGFHPELTGRENIYLNGAILGMGRAEIRRKFDAIVGFAQVDAFIDTPVKRYSSGMYVRLAFAVAAHLEPQILIIDEVLAVGDAAFQQRCLGKMKQVAQSGRTVLFVSHNMAAVNRLCQRALWIDQGKLVMDGPTQQVTADYLSRNTHTSGQCHWPDGAANDGVDELALLAVRIVDAGGRVATRLDTQKDFTVEITYRIHQPLPFCRVGFMITGCDGQPIFESYDSDADHTARRRTVGEYTVVCRVPGHLLAPGRYLLTLNAGIPKVKNLVELEGILSFTLEDTGAIGSNLTDVRQGIIRPRLSWRSIEAPQTQAA